MDLSKIRQEIDSIDDEMLRLFLRRMELCVDVARYKKEKGLPVFQEKREEAILQRISDNSPEGLAEGSRLLYTNIMEISKCLQRRMLSQPQDIGISAPESGDVVIACPGTAGSNTEKACKKLFGGSELKFFPDFADVFEAVQNGSADYGVLPIENSTAGEVDQTYTLLAEYDFYICKSTQVTIDHCLAAKKGGNITKIYSHEQALMQCSRFIKNSGAEPVPYKNTALAAEMVANSDEDGIAAICSEDCARLYGLEILERRIADNPDNTTRFICVSKKNEVSDGADIISISLSVPHTAGALYRLLTRFYFYGLNLTRIQSAPVPKKALNIKTEAFDVIFYLDFEGSVKNPDVVRLLSNLEKEMKYFRYLGNYNHII
ncbi:MAG: chorismate mutase [Eubacterium sp.]|nr:chorismate mutase [Eubacterium sp.]